MVNDKTIAFIVCVNNEKYYQECLWFIHRLSIPEGYEIETICVREAESIVAAYNYAMRQSKAKYKVYLHQDVFIYYKDFISEIIDLFQKNKNIGMLGVVGGINLPQDAECWNHWNCGKTLVCNYRVVLPTTLSQGNGGLLEVEALDGMLLATQYDLEWREDLGLKWDFYDISQSLEFRRRGYKVVIPYQKEYWCLHDCGCTKLENYEVNRQIILREYSDFFRTSYEEKPYFEISQMGKRTAELLKKCIVSENYVQAYELVQVAFDKNIANNAIDFSVALLQIFCAETEEKTTVNSFFGKGWDFDEMKGKYDTVKFFLRRIECEPVSQFKNELESFVNRERISSKAVEIIARGNTRLFS